MEQQHFRTQHNATPYNRNPRFNQRDISHIQSHPINARMNYPVNRSREAGQLHIRSGGAGVMHGGGGFKNAGHGRGRH